MTQRLLVSLDSLATHPDFTFRSWHDTAHLRELRRVLEKSCRKAFDPILAWKDPDSGQQFIVDGHYRAEAYREAGQAARRVPVIFFEGSREDAVLAALRVNAKARLPLSSQERQDAAWKLVRASQAASGAGYTKPRISEASGVSERLVGYMRKRWKDVQAEGADAVSMLTGRWASDREAAAPKGDYELLSDAQRECQIQTLSGLFRDLTDRRKHGGTLPILGDQHAVYEALFRAYGEVWMRGLLEFTLADESDEWCSPLMRSPQVEEDDEPDF